MMTGGFGGHCDETAALASHSTQRCPSLLHDVLPNISGAITPGSIRAAALKVDVPAGDSINGGGVRFGAEGTLDQGQNMRAAAVVGQWQGVQDMRVVYPAAYATAKPIL